MALTPRNPLFVPQNKERENTLIYKALATYQPCTRRKLSDLTGLEIATLCRALFNLVYRLETIKVSHYAPCKVTGVEVMHFALKNWEA